MNALQAMWKVTLLGSEYASAWGVATRALDSGASVKTALRLFADETEAELDDQAIEALITFVGETSDKMKMASHFFLAAAKELEDRGPFIISLLREYGEKTQAAAARLKQL